MKSRSKLVEGTLFGSRVRTSSGIVGTIFCMPDPSVQVYEVTSKGVMTVVRVEDIVECSDIIDHRKGVKELCAKHNIKLVARFEE